MTGKGCERCAVAFAYTGKSGSASIESRELVEHATRLWLLAARWRDATERCGSALGFGLIGPAASATHQASDDQHQAPATEVNNSIRATC